ncbi:hypothetical protein N7478_008079 [Penicillium angulare]|uniref:uncharacterized protein n=1 Tax=Penicillium angulare TaxID=116970 RepID=UPI00254144D4|nr:uncharacterized protein N7478_008079 [Penicillium angulare]KAJ5272954.1 hypothetical protein N7478_008079 [Penicillium angulare]
MTFREKVKRVFHRSSSSTSQVNGRPKVEYYRRHEVPPSKFRGPFDKEHQKRLAAWSFDRAMVDRPRSLDLDLSPYATYENPCDSDDMGDISPDDDGVALHPDFSDSPVSPIEIPTDSPRPTYAGSQSSTLINSDSYSGSVMTLFQEGSFYEIPEDPIAQLKESVRYTSPIVRAMSPAPKAPMATAATKQLPFAPEDLTRALIGLQVCT